MINIGTLLATSGIVAGWGHIKGVLTKIRSIFIITMEVSGGRESCDVVNGYLIRHYKKSNLNSLTFTAERWYLRSKKCSWLVGVELPSSGDVYWNKMFPIVVSRPGDSPENTSRSFKVSISFIRGTLDPRKFFKDALDETNEYKMENDKREERRFFIQHFFGNFKAERPLVVDGDGGVTSYENIFNLKLIGHDIKDIGHVIKKEPFKNLYYGKEVNDFIDEISHWVSNKSWFKDRGLPWKMSALLKGIPGTGKSSLVKAIAQEFDFPIFLFDLNSMSNEELQQYWRRAQSNAPCVILFEDLDRVFKDKQTVIEHNMAGKGNLTLDCLLNCMSGVDDSDGILVFATVNFEDKLDPALLRPGRLNTHLTLRYLDEDSRLKLACKILGGEDFYGYDWTSGIESKSYTDVHKKIADLVTTNPKVTGADFQRICILEAQKMFWEKG